MTRLDGQQHAALLQRRRSADSGALQEGHDLEQRHVLEHRAVRISEGPKKGQVGTKLKITGKFLKGRGEQGTITTTYVGFPNCSGKSTYSTKA